jgi:hypothetical protein
MAADCASDQSNGDYTRIFSAEKTRIERCYAFFDEEIWQGGEIAPKRNKS